MPAPKKDWRNNVIRPEEILVLGFLAVILLGAFLLRLPIASRSGMSVPLFDCFFTATSAVCVTGLVVTDTGTTFSLFGQLVLLALIEIGGLGFMVLATMVMSALGRKLSLKGRMLVRESMNGATLTGLMQVTRLYFALALGIELAGTLVLSMRFVPLYGARHGLWMAAFHAVSAFCNAGFDLFAGYRSLTVFSSDPLVLLTVATLIILGGLGFSVILEVLRSRRDFSPLSLHSRIVLTSTILLLLAGTVFFLLVEWSGEQTLGHFAFGGKTLNAFFQSVTMRTAGFNSIDLSQLKDGSKLFSCALMLIGASPASTGGGVKTTTVAVLVLLMLSVVRGDSEINIARRRLSINTARRALAIASLFLGVWMLGTLSISLIENGRFSLADVLFETSSAMGTVGVSSIGTPNLCAASRAVLLPMMFLGRVGPLTLAVAIARHQGKPRSTAKYPEEKIMIG